MLDMFDLSADQTPREKELLNTCKKSQGEYLPGWHPPTSWATTYSEDFVDAAAALYRLYTTAYENNAVRLRELLGAPQPSRPSVVKVRPSRHLNKAILRHMGQRFKDTGILSCRGATMTFQKVEYLYNAHLRPILNAAHEAAS